MRTTGLRVLLASEDDVPAYVVEVANQGLVTAWAAISSDATLTIVPRVLRIASNLTSMQAGKFALDVINSALAELAPKGQVLLETYDICVGVTGKDLRDGEGWLFGATRDLGAVQSCSISTFRMSTPPDMRVFRRVVQHEFGHALGLVPETRTSNVEESIGLHCTNVCLMRQGYSLEAFRALAHQEEELGVLFCRECTDFLRAE